MHIGYIVGPKYKVIAKLPKRLSLRLVVSDEFWRRKAQTAKLP